MPTTQNIVIDLNTRGANPVAFTHQSDTARSFVFEVYNDGEAFTLTGYTAKIGAMLPADRGYYVIAGDDMATGAISGNKITVTLPAAYTAKSGNGVLTIILTGSGATIRPINVDFRIQKSADAADTVAGASDFPASLAQIVDDWITDNSADTVTQWLEDALDVQSLEDVIDAWLTDHPEATTTIEDGSITLPKLNTDVLNKIELTAPLFEKPTMFAKKTFARLTDGDGNTYGQQGATVTDQYIVLALNSLGTNADKRNLIYVLDKDTYEPATLGVSNPILLEFSSSTTPQSSHANSVAWDEAAGEIYVYTQSSGIAIVFDDTTFAEKRRVTMPANGQIGYDNITKQWCFITYASSTEYAIQIWDSARENLLKTVSGARIGTTQGVLFHDGLIYIPTSVDSSVATFGGMQNIKVLDTDSNLIRSWWFNSGVELEDIGLINEATMLIATNAGNNVSLYEMAYKSAPSIDDLESFDVFNVCGRVDDTSGKIFNKHTGDDGWSYMLDPATHFIVAWGRFNVTPSTWTETASGIYYSDTLSITTPFSMSNYKFSILGGGRKWAINPGHNSTSLSFRLDYTADGGTNSVDINIVLVGFIS